ncbi:Uncharacterised protein [Bordetella pertussis]|nr:Uncharacterised protein [Bordetella pertussis]CFW28604.1 Uncharacterised protein [Bordetella pertussis]
MPTGVPIRVPTPAISTLPTTALSRPPACPGGGVISVNSVNDSAGAPLTSRVAMIQNSQNRPNSSAPSEMVNMTLLTRWRRR